MIEPMTQALTKAPVKSTSAIVETLMGSSRLSAIVADAESADSERDCFEVGGHDHSSSGCLWGRCLLRFCLGFIETVPTHHYGCNNVCTGKFMQVEIALGPLLLLLYTLRDS